MEPEDKYQSSATGKIRVRAHGGRSKQRKPYQRRQTTDSGIAESKESQGLLSKVGSLIVPSWISSWFSGADSKAPESSDSSEDESEKISGTAIRSKPLSVANFLVGNHVKERTSIGVNNNSVSKHTIATPESRTLTSVGRDTVNPVYGTSSIQFSGISSGDTSTPLERGNQFAPPTDDKTLSCTFMSSRTVSSSTALSKSALLPVTPAAVTGAVSVFGTPKPFMAKASSPSFKVSSFVSSKHGDYSRTSISPFYRGRTAFGGASSIREMQSKRQKLSPVSAALKIPKARIQARQLPNRGKETVSGETAKRILRALEKMSTPVQDARRMVVQPLPNISSSSTESASLSTASNRTENVPNAQKILEQSIVETGHSAHSIPPTLPFKPKGLPLSFSPDECSTAKRQSFKMKRQKTYAHQTVPKSGDTESETPNSSTIPELTPFVVKTLPKFDFTQKEKHGKGDDTVSSNLAPVVVEGKKDDTPVATMSDSKVRFSFTAPQVKSSSSQNSSDVSKTRETFNFSKPNRVADSAVSKEGTPPKSDIKTSVSKVTKLTHDSNLLSVGPLTVPKLSPPKGSWECSQCLIKNRPEKEVCVACGNERTSSQRPLKKNVLNPETSIANEKEKETATLEKPTEDPSTSTGEKKSSIFAKFAPKPGSWECDLCMIRNDADKLKCAACQAAKPVSDSLKEKAPSVKQNDSSIFAKFAPKPGSWECDTCMIRNNADQSNCAACQAPKPTKTQNSKPAVKADQSIFAKFAPKPGSWECPTCMISNDADKTKCVACETAKPGLASTSKDATGAKASFGKGEGIFAKFAPKPGSWECDVCMVRNDSDKAKCVACEAPKPGSTQSTSGESAVQKSAFSDGPKFKFGVSAGSEQASKFSFGLPAETNQSSVKFGDAFSTEIKDKAVTGSFSFGLKPGSGTPSFGIAPKQLVNDSTKADTESPKEQVTKPINQGFQGDILKTNIAPSKVTLDLTEPKTNESADIKVSPPTASAEANSNWKSTPPVSFNFMPVDAAKKSELQGSSSTFTTGIRPVVSNTMFNAGAQDKSDENKIPPLGKVEKPNNSLSSGFNFGTPSKATDNETTTSAASATFNFGTGLTQDRKSTNGSLPMFASSLSAASKPVSNNLPATTFTNIAEAAKGGFLQVPGVEEKSNSNILTTVASDKPQFGPIVANGPVASSQEPTKAFSTIGQGFSISTSSSVPPAFAFGSQLVKSSPATLPSSSAPLFALGKGAPSQQSIEKSALNNNVSSTSAFSFGVNPGPQQPKENSIPSGTFAFTNSATSNNVFGQSPQVTGLTSKGETQPTFKFGPVSTSTPAFGGFSFSQVPGTTSTAATPAFGFGNSAASVPSQQPASNVFDGMQSGGFNFSSSSSLKTGGFNFMGTPSDSSSQNAPFAGAFGGQQALFNLGSGGASASGTPGGNRPQGMPVKKIRKATRRLK